jgi:four helix bundle protein
MATILKFEDILAWQKAGFFCNNIFEISIQTKLGTDFKLRDQINGSAGSVMDNVAEGYGWGGSIEFIQFLEISHASACESQSQLYRILDRKHINQEHFTKLYNMAEEIKKMLRGLVQYLNKTPLPGVKYKDRVKKQH